MSKTYLSEDRLSDCIYLLQPSRPVLVTTRNPDGSVNVAPFSWLMPVSQHPPLVALALLTTPRKQHSLVNVEREGVFVVNLPGLEIADKLVRSSYRYPPGVNKFDQIGFSPEPSREADLPAVGECRAHLECRLIQTVPTGDHTLLIASVIAAAYDPELFDDRLLLQLDRAKPCVHLRQRKDKEGQTHFFLEPAGIRAVEVPYALGTDPNGVAEPPKAPVGAK